MMRYLLSRSDQGPMVQLGTGWSVGGHTLLQMTVVKGLNSKASRLGTQKAAEQTQAHRGVGLYVCLGDGRTATEARCLRPCPVQGQYVFASAPHRSDHLCNCDG